MGEADVRVLRELRAAAGGIGIEKLSSCACLPVGETRRILDEFREAGYEIEHHPHHGIRLLASPDRLIADDLMGRLAGASLVRDILVIEETASTNDVAARLGFDGVKEGVVVFAESQTAGRGRLGRKWESEPRGGLWFSILMRPPQPLSDWMRLTTWAAVGVARGIERVTRRSASVKWPNDVLLDGKKVTGILLEAHRPNDDGFAVVGIGINVNQAAFPAELADRATSLRIAAGKRFERMEVAAAVLRALSACSQEMQADFAGIVAEAWRRSSLADCHVEIGMGEHRVAGVAEGLGPQGELLVKAADGVMHSISGGEVTVLATRQAV